MPELVSDSACPDNRQRRAAALRGVGALVGPELERHRDHLGSALAFTQGSDRGVDTAAERDENSLAPRWRHRDPLSRDSERCERAVKRVGRKVGAVAALRTEPAGLRRQPRRHRSVLRRSPGVPRSEQP